MTLITTIIITALALPVALVLSLPQSQSPSPRSTTNYAPTTWVHPGFVVSNAQLAFMKSQVAAKAEPWSAAYAQMLKDEDAYGLYASPTTARKSQVTDVVGCGPTTKPDLGCTDERGDALAAWANALAWAASGEEGYARNSIGLMNKWSAKIKSHTLQNAVLQTAWAGASWARAGELIKHTTTNLWAAADVEKFGTMLKTVYLPACVKGDTRASNWDMACLNTALGISVFLEDAETYNSVMGLFQEAVPSVIYLDSDGKLPHQPRDQNLDESAMQSHWFGQQTWENPGQSGQIQETCRDLTHTGYSISSISHILETSRIQGKDLYETDLGDRLRYALEFHAQFVEGKELPSWLCEGKPLQRKLEYVTEIGFNALDFRPGNETMGNTQKYTLATRPEGTNALFYGWETLTHAGNKA